ncbi:hypothetical protein [Piscicoccus intestinalis]|uniref:hypothetical protein n=1 Tax=Piscicoccus intestinalis TaxID=746033 RepID=UPI0012EE78BC|nr:hypothetical protein [Piscicoccus intestinalis]
MNTQTPVRPVTRGHSAALPTALAAVAVAACVPYVALKIAWLAGSDVGVRTDALGSGTMQVANTLTLVMELVAAALAVALVRPIGLRIPAPLVLVPMAVGTGLLGGILVLLPIEAALALTGLAEAPRAPDAEPLIAGWVYAVVYAGFAVLGLALLAIFAIHVKRRWAVGWHRPLATLAGGTDRGTRLLTVLSAALLAVCLTESVVNASRAAALAHPIMGVVAAAAALTGSVMLGARRPAGCPIWLPVVGVFAGASAVAAWGLFFAVLFLVPNPLVGETAVPAALPWLMAARALLGSAVLLHLVRLAGRLAARG